MITIEEKYKCCGCTACANRCPKGAIDMVEDDCGFKYPNINLKKCIDCGLCEKVCPVLNNKDVKNEPKAYACVNNNKKIRFESSSGGVFTLISDYVLDNNGIVFGAAFDNNFELKHIYVDNKRDLHKLRTSKYLQSYIGDSYQNAKKFLDDNKLVLFTGTPCQVEGLKSFLNKEYSNLYTQDIICHGVPSPKVWRKYREYRKKLDNDEPQKINFRDKSDGWHKCNLRFEYNNNKFYSKSQCDDIYMKLFLSDLCLRDSCYKCSFKKYNRNSDITLADFWGIENINKKFDDNKGTSLVIINSEKGYKLLDNIKNGCSIIEEVDLEEAIKYNPSFIKSVNSNKNRENFFNELNSKSFDYFEKKYVKKTSIIKKVIGKFKSRIKKLINKI